MDGAQVWGDSRSLPDAVLDGGGEEWSVLGAAIERCLAVLVPTQLLEVLSQDGEARAVIPAWCSRRGHDLVATTIDGAIERFVIRKGGDERGDEPEYMATAHEGVGEDR